jgi:hypothetical protein
VVVTWSKIRDVLERLYADVHCHGGHYTVFQHTMSFVLNDPTQFLCVSQYTSHNIVVPYCMNSTISTPFLSQKTVAINQLSGKTRFV